MAKKTKTTTRGKKKLNTLTSASSLEFSPSVMESGKNKRSWFKISLLLVVVAIILALIFRKYRNQFIVATVDGSPILRAELNKRLTSRFGAQILEAVIGEHLILAQAQKQNVQVTTQEVDAKIKEIEKTLNGSVSLDDSLKMQGISKDEFVNQVRLQILIDKMIAQDVSTSAQEVDDFMKNNSTALTASTEAERRQQAEKEVKNNKVSQKFVEWFTKLKEAAKINRYL